MKTGQCLGFTLSPFRDISRALMKRDSTKNDLLTKDDIARELSPDAPLHERSVQRYIQLAGVEPAIKGSGRGKQAKFARADVEKIKTAYQTAAENRHTPSHALTTTKPDTLQPVAVVAELMTSNAENFQRLSSALDTWSMWLTRAEVIERTGLPASWIDAAIRKDKESKEQVRLPFVGNGRARRFHRDDVRAFAERVRDRKYLTALFQ
jgi:hypothetical protein